MLNSDESDVLLDPSQYEDSIVLKVFWSDNENSINSNFVIICNNRVDVYNVSLDNYIWPRTNKLLVFIREFFAQNTD